MSAPGNTFLSTGLGVLFLIVLCYVGGRLHQWYKHTFEREEAFREGYDRATRSLFSLATRTNKDVVAVARAPEFQTGVARGAAPIPLNTVQQPLALPPVTPPKERVPRHRANSGRILPVTKKFDVTALQAKKSA